MLLWVNISQCLLLFAHVCTKVKAQAVCMVRLNRRLHKNLIKPRNTVDISSKRIRSLDKANHRTPKPPKGLGAIELVVCCRQQSTGMWNLTGAIANCWYLDVESADVGPLWCPLGRAWTWLQGVAVLSMDGLLWSWLSSLDACLKGPIQLPGQSRIVKIVEHACCWGLMQGFLIFRDWNRVAAWKSACLNRSDCDARNHLVRLAGGNAE